MAETGLWAPRFKGPAGQAPELRVIREAVRREHKLPVPATRTVRTLRQSE